MLYCPELWGPWLARKQWKRKMSSINKEQAHRSKQRRRLNLCKQDQNFPQEKKDLVMALYADLTLQDTMKEQLFRWAEVLFLYS